MARQFTVITDVIDGTRRTYRGKEVFTRAWDFEKRKMAGPKKSAGFVEVVVGPLRYFLAPKSGGSLYTANNHEGWYLVEPPTRTRRSESASARKGQGMVAWEKAALDKAVLEVLDSWHTVGADPGLLAEDLFENWGIGMNANFLRHAAEGREISPQGKKLAYSKAARRSAVAASLARLVKAKKAVKFNGGKYGEKKLFKTARFA